MKMITRTNALFLASGIAIAMSLVLIQEQSRVIHMMQNVSLPLVADVTNLEQREKVLREQIELTELSHTLQIRSTGEYLDVYVLPKETDMERLVTVFDILQEDLREQGLLGSMSDVSIGDRQEQGGMHRRPLTVSMTIHENGLRFLMTLFDLAGLLTVSDALSAREVDALFQSTEAENPAGIVALEQFLSLDILSFARDTRLHTKHLKRSFVSPLFERTLEGVLGNSRLRDAERIFAGRFGEQVQAQKLWPLQFMTMERIRTEKGAAEGWYTLDLTLAIWEK